MCRWKGQGRLAKRINVSLVRNWGISSMTWLRGIERECWISTEIRLGSYGFQDTITTSINQRLMNQTGSGGKMGASYVNLQKRGNKTAGQPSAGEGCEKMHKQRWQSNASRGNRYRHFTGRNQRAPKNDNSRSSNISGWSESTSRKTYEWFNRTRLGRAKTFTWNGMTGSKGQSSRDKSLVCKEEQYVIKIESRRGAAGCERSLDEDQQKRTCTSTGSYDRRLETNSQTKMTGWRQLVECLKYGNGSTTWYMDTWSQIQKDMYQGEGEKKEASINFSTALG